MHFCAAFHGLPRIGAYGNIWMHAPTTYHMHPGLGAG
jgi:hypothetical protein